MAHGGGRSGSRAVPLALIAALACTAAPPVPAQVSFRLTAGIRYSSTLVHDSIVTPFDVRPAAAPALALTAISPLQHGWAVLVTLDGSSSQLVRHDANSATTDLGRVTAASFTVGLRHGVGGHAGAAGAVGALKYFPADETGIFRAGSAPIAGVGALIVDYQPPFAVRYRLALEARYDVHAFTTPALEQEGFTSSRLVQRVSVSLRAGGRGP